jgi:Zn-dependent protease with chaperone function
MLKRSLFAGAAVLALSVVAAGTAERLSGYAEYHKPGIVIVDGQRVRQAAGTKISGARTVEQIPLGYETEVTGTRAGDGSVVAASISARPNGTQAFEDDVLKATDQIESEWVGRGFMYEPQGGGQAKKVGDILKSGPDVDRVRHIMDRLRPSYIPASRLRVHVVQTKEWNASAMGNGAIWVYTGILDEMTDDEMAIVLGHELAHFSHEHSRRSRKRGMWTSIVGLGAVVASSTLDNDGARIAAMSGSMLGMTAFSSGYSRDLEDQADRVGLRYAHEAGYDVRKGPVLWGKFRKKYGERDSVTNFFVGSHSRPSDRIRNIERELRTNYRTAG